MQLLYNFYYALIATFLSLRKSGKRWEATWKADQKEPKDKRYLFSLKLRLFNSKKMVRLMR